MVMRQGSTRGTVIVFALLLGWNAGIALAGGDEDLVLPDAMLGARVAPMLLLTRADVRDDLKLTAEQAASARDTLADLRARALTLRGRGNSAEVIAGRRAIDEIQWRWLATQLTAEQRDRLNQIDLQWEGPKALIRPSVVDSLGLSDDQRARLSRTIGERARAGQGTSPAALFESLVGELSPDQKERWKLMLGTSFRVVPSASASAGRPDPGVSRTSNRP